MHEMDSFVSQELQEEKNLERTMARVSTSAFCSYTAMAAQFKEELHLIWASIFLITKKHIVDHQNVFAAK